eukprot:2303119-Rhodomonas_salina.3
MCWRVSVSITSSAAVGCVRRASVFERARARAGEGGRKGERERPGGAAGGRVREPHVLRLFVSYAVYHPLQYHTPLSPSTSAPSSVLGQYHRLPYVRVPVVLLGTAVQTDDHTAGTKRADKKVSCI